MNPTINQAGKVLLTAVVREGAKLLCNKAYNTLPENSFNEAADSFCNNFADTMAFTMGIAGIANDNHF